MRGTGYGSQQGRLRMSSSSVQRLDSRGCRLSVGLPAYCVPSALRHGTASILGYGKDIPVTHAPNKTRDLQAGEVAFRSIRGLLRGSRFEQRECEQPGQAPLPMRRDCSSGCAAPDG
ncbi:uncharacterized protein [Dermacentor albipictus]|uniref:uncharacterized protein isoform X2 n=1 Tax=Dermacentor albipictus TaxID=60249 RepID=UPI0031FCC404